MLDGVNDWRVFRKGQFVLASPTREEAEDAFAIIRKALPEKYLGTHIEWQRSIFGEGAVGTVVETNSKDVPIRYKLARKHDAFTSSNLS